MQPGSLIFLVIVAVWAVFLVQHWIRRRDHLATARSVDRISEAMRVLERRAAPRFAASGLYADTPRPERATRPVLVGRQAAASRPSAAHGVSARVESARVEPARVDRARPSAGRPAPRPAARPRAGSTLLARRVRGVVVLLTLAAVPVTAVLSAVGALRWVSVAVAAGALVVAVAWTRASVRREQAVRRAARVGERRRIRPPRDASATPARASTGAVPRRPVPARASASASAEAAPRVRQAAPGAGREAAPQVVSAVGVLPEVTPQTQPQTHNKPETETPRQVAAELAAQVTTEATAPEVYDLSAVDEAERAAVAAAAFAQEWSPVPVPTPTYMLKDSAHRTASEPALAVVPVPIEVEDDELEQLMAARHRRIVG